MDRGCFATGLGAGTAATARTGHSEQPCIFLSGSEPQELGSNMDENKKRARRFHGAWTVRDGKPERGTYARRVRLRGKLDRTCENKED